MLLPLTRPARYKGAYGGRGGAKSHFFAEQLVIKAVTTNRLRWACLREIQKSLQNSVKTLIEDKIRGLGVSHYFDIKEDRIKTPGGGVIVFMGMQNHTVDSLKSLEDFDGAWFEEAQKASQNSLNIMRPTFRKASSELWFSWNPVLPSDPIEQLLRPGSGEPLPPDSIIVETNYWNNPWFWKNATLVNEMKYDKRRDPERYQHVWCGGYQTRGEARVFKNIVIQEFDTPPKMKFMFGCDWGFAQDPTVLVRAFEAYGADNRLRLYIDREAWQIGLEIDHTPAFFAGDDLVDGPIDPYTNRPSRILRPVPRWQNPRKYKGVPEALNWPIIADSSDPQNISYMRRHGFDKMMPAVKGPNSVEQGLNFLQKYEEIVIHEEFAPHAADEFLNYSYKVDKHTDKVLNELQQDKNHTIDSVRYSVEPKRRNVGGEPTFGRY